MKTWDTATLSKLPPETQKELVELGKDIRKGYYDIKHFSRSLLGIDLHKGQEQFLDETNPITHPLRRKNIIVPANRWGKTVTLAIKHLWFLFYKIGFDSDDIKLSTKQRYATLNLSPHSNQVEMCYNYINDILHSRLLSLDKDGKRVINKCRISSFFVSDNAAKKRIRFSNNSMFFGQSSGEDQGAAIQGWPFGYIAYDECVQSHHLAEELDARVFSRTIDFNAPVDLTATPDQQAKSQQHYYHMVKMAEKKMEGFDYVQFGKLDDNKFLPLANREAKKKELLATNPQMYKQVVLGEFVSSAINVFPTDSIDDIWNREAKQWTEPQNKEQTFLLSADWGGSDTGDPTVFMVLLYRDLKTLKPGEKPFKIVYHEQFQGGSPSVQLATAQNLKESWNNARFIGDTAALGGIWIKKLLNEKGVKMEDFTARGGEKGDAVLIARDMVIKRYIESYYIQKLEEQMGAYMIDDKKLVQDYVVVLYQALWWLERKFRLVRKKEKAKDFKIRHGRNNPV